MIRIGAAAELSEGEISAVSNAIATITVIVQKTDKVRAGAACAGGGGKVALVWKVFRDGFL